MALSSCTIRTTNSNICFALAGTALVALLTLRGAGSLAAEAAFSHGSWVSSVAFLPDGKRLVTAGFDNQAKLWDLAHTNGPVRVLSENTNRPPREMCFLELAYLNSAALTSDGSRLLTSGQHNALRLWDVTNPIPTSRVIDAQGWWHKAAISPDGRWVLAAGVKSACLWELPSLKSNLLPHPAVVGSVCFSPDGTRFLTGCQDRQVRLWKTTDPGAPLATFAHPSWVGAVEFSADGRRMLTGCDDFKARLWDVEDPAAPITVFAGHTGYVKAVAFSPDGSHILTGSQDKTARLWDINNAQTPLRVLPHPSWVYCVAFSPDGTRIATGCYDYMARVWDLDTAPRHPL